MHWKSWDHMCLPKNKGGLGFKSFITQNSSLLFKKAWRCLNNLNDYWAKILRGVYCNREDFWNVKPKVGCSWVWRNILHGRDIPKEKGRWIMGDGNSTDIKGDN